MELHGRRAPSTSQATAAVIRGELSLYSVHSIQQPRDNQQSLIDKNHTNFHIASAPKFLMWNL